MWFFHPIPSTTTATLTTTSATTTTTGAITNTTMLPQITTARSALQLNEETTNN